MCIKGKDSRNPGKEEKRIRRRWEQKNTRSRRRKTQERSCSSTRDKGDRKIMSGFTCDYLHVYFCPFGEEIQGFALSWSETWQLFNTIKYQRGRQHIEKNSNRLGNCFFVEIKTQGNRKLFIRTYMAALPRGSCSKKS